MAQTTISKACQRTATSLQTLVLSWRDKHDTLQTLIAHTNALTARLSTLSPPSAVDSHGLLQDLRCFGSIQRRLCVAHTHELAKAYHKLDLIAEALEEDVFGIAKLKTELSQLYKEVQAFVSCEQLLLPTLLKSGGPGPSAGAVMRCLQSLYVMISLETAQIQSMVQSFAKAFSSSSSSSLPVLQEKTLDFELVEEMLCQITGRTPLHIKQAIA